MAPELVDVLCWVGFGVVGVMALYISSKIRDIFPFAIWVGVGIIMAVAGCATSNDREDDMEQDKPTLAERWDALTPRWGELDRGITFYQPKGQGDCEAYALANALACKPHSYTMTQEQVKFVAKHGNGSMLLAINELKLMGVVDSFDRLLLPSDVNDFLEDQPVILTFPSLAGMDELDPMDNLTLKAKPGDTANTGHAIVLVKYYKGRFRGLIGDYYLVKDSRRNCGLCYMGGRTLRTLMKHHRAKGWVVFTKNDEVK